MKKTQDKALQALAAPRIARRVQPGNHVAPGPHLRVQGLPSGGLLPPPVHEPPIDRGGAEVHGQTVGPLPGLK